MMVKKLDEKDYKILDVLKNNSNLSTKQIARHTEVPITTVHNRIKKLTRSGIIKNYSIVLNNDLLGDIVAYILISVMYHTPDKTVIDQEELARNISKIDNVEETSIITGATDFIVKVRSRSMDELNDFVVKYLRNIPGIERTQTLVALKTL